MSRLRCKRPARGGSLGNRVISLLPVAAVAAAALFTTPSLAQVASPRQIDHWGNWFGDPSDPGGGQKIPTALTFPAQVTQVASSNSDGYALLSNGQVWAWGQGTRDELGDGRTANAYTAPVRVRFPAGVTIAYLPTDAMPYDTGLAVDTAGNAWGWGRNAGGSLCLGNTDPRPVPVQLPLMSVTALAGAYSHAFYDSNGTVYACGRNYDGVLGTGAKQALTPVAVTGLPAGPVTALTASYGDGGALINGTVWQWGANNNDQLGDGESGGESAVPVQVTFPGPSSAVQVAQGGSSPQNGQTLVMLSDGSMYAWGDDAWRQLGDGQTANKPSPIPLSPPAGVTLVRLASSGATSYAIDSKGNVWAWGDGADYQIGNGKKNSQPEPAKVDSGAEMISATAFSVVVGP